MHTSFIRQHSSDLGVLKRFDESSHLNHSICSPLRTYNMSNHHSYTQHTAFKPHILHLIRILMSLLKVQNHNASTSNNMPFRHLPKLTRDPINISQTDIDQPCKIQINPARDPISP